MKTQTRWTIAIKSADGSRRKITKIIGLHGKGFSVLAPYHSAKSGLLEKMPVDPTKQAYHVPFSNSVSFTAEDKVKLTYHTDGFAQFSSQSGNRIVSGIDPNTREPKGLGLFTNPLTSPIWTGASVGVTVWGLDDFDQIDKTDSRDALLSFDADDFYYRNCTPNSANAWIIQIYALPTKVSPPIRFLQGTPVLDVVVEGLNGRLSAVVQMKVISLPHEVVLLGAYVSAFRAQYIAKSGWIFNGPGNYALGRRGHVLMGLYPRDGIKITNRPSLDRAQSVTSAQPADE